MQHWRGGIVFSDGRTTTTHFSGDHDGARAATIRALRQHRRNGTRAVAVVICELNVDGPAGEPVIGGTGDFLTHPGTTKFFEDYGTTPDAYRHG